MYMISLGKFSYIFCIALEASGQYYVIYIGSIYIMLVNIMHLSMSSLITEECRRQTGSANPHCGMHGQLTYNNICSQEFA